MKDLQNLNAMFDFDSLNKDHETFCFKNKKVIGKFKIETLEIVFVDEFMFKK